MPHIVIEYSDNLSKQIKSSKATALAHKAVVDSGLFSPEAVKARSLAYDDYVLHNEAKSFLHVTISILTGRNEEERKALSGVVFKTISNAIPDADKVSVNIHEMDKASYTK